VAGVAAARLSFNYGPWYVAKHIRKQMKLTEAPFRDFRALPRRAVGPRPEVPAERPSRPGGVEQCGDKAEDPYLAQFESCAGS